VKILCFVRDCDRHSCVEMQAAVVVVDQTRCERDCCQLQQLLLSQLFVVLVSQWMYVFHFGGEFFRALRAIFFDFHCVIFVVEYRHVLLETD